tara:strand:- start:4713 stop:6623 length:1911 start_codon:yes stop_codon:yes gene_type:complete
MNISIQANTQVMINDTLMLVDDFDVTNGLIRFKDQATRRTYERSLSEFTQDYENKVIKLIPKDEDVKIHEMETRRQISSYDKEDLQKAMVREGWLYTSIDEDGNWLKDTKERLRRRKEYALSIGEKEKAMSDRNVRRFYARWKANGRNMVALIPNISKRGNRELKLTDLHHQLIDEMIDKKYLQATRPCISAVHRLINEEIGIQPQYMHLEKVSRSTVERKIKKIDEYERCFRREGFLTAKNKFPYGSPVVKPDYLLQRVELDHTPIDIEILDDTREHSIGRVWLTVVQEYMSKMICGYHLAAYAPCSRSVIEAVKHATLPKEGLKEGYSWPCMGLMSELSIDNGMDLHAANTKMAMAQLDVDVHYNPKGRPHYKGSVERVQRTLNEQVTELLPGRTFSNYIKKGNYKSNKNACLTLSDLKSILDEWIVSVYHETVHSTLNDKPINVWRRLEMNMPAMRLPPTVESFEKLLWKVETKQIHKKGICTNSRVYNSVELQDIAKKIGRKKNVEVFIDQDDISKVQVQLPNSNEYIDAHLTDSRYAALRLSKADHKETVVKAKEIFKDKDGNDVPTSKFTDEQLVAAWHEIVKIRDEARNSTSKAKRERQVKQDAKNKSPEKAPNSKSNAEGWDNETSLR